MSVTGRLTQRVSPARTVAFETLDAVEGGAYASDALRELSSRLEARDAGLASQIAFGCLRYQAQLDYLIGWYSGRPAAGLDSAVRIALRSAVFQMRYLQRIPPHAAVSETVEMVKAHKRAAAGLANAVLRKVNREAVSWPDEATELSCPGWLLERWRTHFGREEARQIALAALQQPEAYIRVRPGAEWPEGLKAEPTEVAGCFRLEAPLDAKLVKAGMRLQDISSQAIVPKLDLRPGHTYLDLCAAPGNKTLQALETPLALAVACDYSLTRIKEIPPVCPRVVLDGTKSLPFGIEFDRIFIDAPCSGTGTLGRNPEIKWRVQERDPKRFGEKQLALVGEALKRLKPGGKLLYATCSLEREENEDVLEELARHVPEVAYEKGVWRLPGRDAGDGFYAAALTRVNVLG